MGCKWGKTTPVNEPAIQRFTVKDDNNDIRDDSVISQRNTTVNDSVIAELPRTHNHVKIQVADPQAFNNSLIQQRQQAVNNTSYQSTIQSWNPKTLQQLVDAMKSLGNGKSLVDRHWIIFYWVAHNIEYDTVSYFSKDYKDQSAEGVFRTKKGVCAGYANIYKHLCDELEMPCEVVSGYSKGYGFDDREEAPTETDHAWNAVEIDRHWYLMESTWGAGHLDDNKQFKRELTSYYFLPRPNEMIYHHLPENEKWQLLQTPIQMTQYMQMPKVHPLYFQLNIQLIKPHDQGHVDLLPDKPYALVLLRTPSDVHITAGLKLKDKKIIGGHRVMFDKREQLYYCYFAPSTIGKHKITIYGKRGKVDNGMYGAVLDLTVDVQHTIRAPISFPETWEKFFDLDLEVIKPPNTHLIKLEQGANHTQIQIKTPENVELLGSLENENKEEVIGGDQVYYDRQKHIWRCYFAPNRDGLFTAVIMAKKKSDPGSYSSAVSFEIEAKQISSSPLSYPKAWQLFYDLDLKIIAPKNRSSAVWPDNASYTEVLIQAPTNIQLSCRIEYNNVEVQNGSLAQYDNEKKLWQLLFAPQQTGLHELIVFAQKNNNTETGGKPVVKFDLNVTKLRQPMKFPLIYTKFQATKCQIYTPTNGILKKGAVVPIHCVIPGATDVNLKVDSKWLNSEGYTDPILKRQITVGSQDVVVYARYGDTSSYDGLIKYTVK